MKTPQKNTMKQPQTNTSETSDQHRSTMATPAADAFLSVLIGRFDPC